MLPAGLAGPPSRRALGEVSLPLSARMPRHRGFESFSKI